MMTIDQETLTHVTPEPAPLIIPRQRRPRQVLQTVAFHGGAGALSLLWFAPLALVVLTSFRRFDDVALNGVASWPRSLWFGSYRLAWGDGGMRDALVNSFIITLPALLAAMVLSSLAAFGLSRYEIPFRRTILLLMLSGNLLPPQIMLVPLNQIVESLGIFDTYLAVIIIHVAFGLGFYTFLLYGFMRAIPKELQQAALIDGAGTLQIFGRIIIPLSRPALAATGALGFTFIFNDLLWAITVLRSQDLMPVTPALLGLQGAYVSDYTLLSAGTVIAAIPTFLVFILFQRYFVDGITVGAVK